MAGNMDELVIPTDEMPDWLQTRIKGAVNQVIDLYGLTLYIHGPLEFLLLCCEDDGSTGHTDEAHDIQRKTCVKCNVHYPVIDYLNELVSDFTHHTAFVRITATLCQLCREEEGL